MSYLFTGKMKRENPLVRIYSGLVPMDPGLARLKRVSGIVGFSAALSALNLLSPGNPGFWSYAFNPYLFSAFLIASYYGKSYGILSILCSAGFLFAFYPAGGTDLITRGAIPLAAGLVVVYMFGLIRDSFSGRGDAEAKKADGLAVENAGLRKEVESLRSVNGQLEQRVSRQSDSITLLSGKIEELYSVNLDSALSTILDIVQQFTGATRCSLWKYLSEEKRLVRWASLGDSAIDEPDSIPAEGTIEGWVVRNKSLFSVRMFLQYANLNRMDSGRNIYTAPISTGQSLWGVLNIEELPFERYNLYTEKLIQLILSLSAPALERAQDYESHVGGAGVNAVTGFPAYRDFLAYLAGVVEDAKAERHSVSVFIFELTNYAEISGLIGVEGVERIFARLSASLKKVGRNQTYFFQYREPKQFAVIHDGLDMDGASLFSLEALEAVNRTQWKMEETVVHPEIIVGFASLGESDSGVSALIERSERILGMQRR
jgi:polysaccharide biosynthesis protein PelD